MSNRYGISDQDERRIRARDTRCVYCGVIFKNSPRRDSATIEHFNNDEWLAEYFNVAMCCRACNSSKGVKSLLTWLDSPCCQTNGINQHSVADVVREYLRRFPYGVERRTAAEVQR